MRARWQISGILATVAAIVCVGLAFQLQEPRVRWISIFLALLYGFAAVFNFRKASGRG